MQPSLTLGLPPLQHEQGQFMMLPLSWHLEQCLDFRGGHSLVGVHAASLARWVVGVCQAGLMVLPMKTPGTWPQPGCLLQAIFAEILFKRLSDW